MRRSVLWWWSFLYIELLNDPAGYSSPAYCNSANVGLFNLAQSTADICVDFNTAVFFDWYVMSVVPHRKWSLPVGDTKATIILIRNDASCGQIAPGTRGIYYSQHCMRQHPMTIELNSQTWLRGWAIYNIPSYQHANLFNNPSYSFCVSWQVLI